jgi:hypothetical protein
MPETVIGHTNTGELEHGLAKNNFQKIYITIQAENVIILKQSKNYV